MKIKVLSFPIYYYRLLDLQTRWFKNDTVSQNFLFSKYIAANVWLANSFFKYIRRPLGLLVYFNGQHQEKDENVIENDCKYDCGLKD